MPERFAIRWTRTAEADLASILEFVARQDGADRAIRLYADLRSVIDGLRTLPRRARPIPELAALGLRDYREALVGPYRIWFRLDRRAVVLLGVVDGRRDLEALLFERAVRADDE